MPNMDKVLGSIPQMPSTSQKTKKRIWGSMASGICLKFARPWVGLPALGREGERRKGRKEARRTRLHVGSL